MSEEEQAKMNGIMHGERQTTRVRRVTTVCGAANTPGTRYSADRGVGQTCRRRRMEEGNNKNGRDSGRGLVRGDRPR